VTQQHPAYRTWRKGMLIYWPVYALFTTAGVVYLVTKITWVVYVVLVLGVIMILTLGILTPVVYRAGREHKGASS
jgi:hypothetical protein